MHVVCTMRTMKLSTTTEPKPQNVRLTAATNRLASKLSNELGISKAAVVEIGLILLSRKPAKTITRDPRTTRQNKRTALRHYTRTA